MVMIPDESELVTDRQTDRQTTLLVYCVALGRIIYALFTACLHRVDSRRDGDDTRRIGACDRQTDRQTYRQTTLLVYCITQGRIIYALFTACLHRVDSRRDGADTRRIGACDRQTDRPRYLCIV